MPPLIGITSLRAGDGIVLNQAYAAAVSQAGGLPLILPSLIKQQDIPALLSSLDALVLTGGGDIHPRFWHEEYSSLFADIDEERDIFELELCTAAYHADLPLLAVCRGLQVMAVALGGSVWQDLSLRKEVNLQHRQSTPKWYAAHQVALAGPLRDLAGDEVFAVNSLHHQAIKLCPPALTVVAKTADGVIEAAMAEDKKFFLGVQWHPEYLHQSPLGDELFQILAVKAKE